MTATVFFLVVLAVANHLASERASASGSGSAIGFQTLADATLAIRVVGVSGRAFGAAGLAFQFDELVQRYAKDRRPTSLGCPA